MSFFYAVIKVNVSSLKLFYKKLLIQLCFLSKKCKKSFALKFIPIKKSQSSKKTSCIFIACKLKS